MGENCRSCERVLYLKTNASKFNERRDRERYRYRTRSLRSPISIVPSLPLVATIF